MSEELKKEEEKEQQDIQETRKTPWSTYHFTTNSCR